MEKVARLLKPFLCKLRSEVEKRAFLIERRCISVNTTLDRLHFYTSADVWWRCGNRLSLKKTYL